MFIRKFEIEDTLLSASEVEEACLKIEKQHQKSGKTKQDVFCGLYSKMLVKNAQIIVKKTYQSNNSWNYKLYKGTFMQSSKWNLCERFYPQSIILSISQKDVLFSFRKKW